MHSARDALNIVVCVPPLEDELEDELELLEEDELELLEEDELELLEDVASPELDVLLALVELLDEASPLPPEPPAPDDDESPTRGS